MGAGRESGIRGSESGMRRDRRETQRAERFELKYAATQVGKISRRSQRSGLGRLPGLISQNV